jgi:hypothetical protein
MQYNKRSIGEKKLIKKLVMKEEGKISDELMPIAE